MYSEHRSCCRRTPGQKQSPERDNRKRGDRAPADGKGPTAPGRGKRRERGRALVTAPGSRTSRAFPLQGVQKVRARKSSGLPAQRGCELRQPPLRCRCRRRRRSVPVPVLSAGPKGDPMRQGEGAAASCRPRRPRSTALRGTPAPPARSARTGATGTRPDRAGNQGPGAPGRRPPPAGSPPRSPGQLPAHPPAPRAAPSRAPTADSRAARALAPWSRRRGRGVDAPVTCARGARSALYKQLRRGQAGSGGSGVGCGLWAGQGRAGLSCSRPQTPPSIRPRAR